MYRGYRCIYYVCMYVLCIEWSVQRIAEYRNIKIYMLGRQSSRIQSSRVEQSKISKENLHLARASGETLDLEGFMIVSVCSFFLPVFFYFCFFSSSIFYSFFILLFLLLLLSTSRVIILPISGQLLHYTTFTTQFNFISTYIQIHNIQIYTPRSFPPNPSRYTGKPQSTHG